MSLVAGLSTSVALTVLDRIGPQARAATAEEPANARAIETFRERIGEIRTAEDLVADFEVYSFVMKAFDLEDQIFGKAIMRKTFESDRSDPKALVNRLTDQRFEDIHAALDFAPGKGGTTEVTRDPPWQAEVIERFKTRQFIAGQEAVNPDLGRVLTVREKIGDVDSWYDVLSDPDLTAFMQTALGLPASVSGLDIDRQVEMYSARIDIADLGKPETLERLERKYVALRDVLAPQGPAQAPIVGLVAPRDPFAPVTLDISAITRSPARPYR